MAILAAKATRLLCRLTGRSGTSLPGAIALRIDPKILARLSSRFRVVEVTGTNGKTTTTGMISKILEANGFSHIINKSGANMATGIATTFIDGVDVRGRSSCEWAVLEVDESTLGQISEWIRPDVLVVTNFFRDQLDRYGETYSVIDVVLAGIGRAPAAKLVLNADDSLCAYLGVKSKNQAVYFGIEQGAAPQPEEKDISATSYCRFCKKKYEYSYKVLGHLGGFRCTGCGFERPAPQVRCTRVESVENDSSAFEMEMEGEKKQVRLNLPGLYNIYNALAATACCRQLGLPTGRTLEVLESMESCFGRMESIPIGGGKRILLMLVKNPVGFNQILNYLISVGGPLSVAFLLNDRDQDGTDVSWLWDVDFEQLYAVHSGIDHLYASGLRAEDMALRLKYAGFAQEKIQMEKDFRLLMEKSLSELQENGTLYIAATYTAMMELRAFLRKIYGLKGIYE